MIAEFEQKRGFETRNFVLYKDKITIDTKTSHNKFRYDVKLESLGFDLHYSADNMSVPKKIRNVLIFLMVVPIASYLIYKKMTLAEVGFTTFLVGLLAFLFHLNKGKDDLYLVGGQKNIVFFRTAPSEEAVLEFIEKIKQATKDMLKERYIKFDSTTKEDDYYAALNWLKHNGIITQDEYIEHKNMFDITRLL